MLGRTKTQAVMDQAASSKDFALALSRDKKFRKQLLSAIGHGAKAKRRAAKRVGRSEERRVGKECPVLCRSRWSPYH